jgi:hypothetical protein
LIALGGCATPIAFVNVSITGPRVSVRWQDNITATARQSLESRYDLRIGEPDLDSPSRSVWRYQLGDRSVDNVRELVEDPAAADTGGIDRDTFSARPADVRIRIRATPPSLRRLLERTPHLLRDHRSMWLLAAAIALLAAANAAAERRRRRVTIGVLAITGVMALAMPLDPSFVRMGEAAERFDRRGFEEYFAGRVRFEKHLSQVLLFERYQQLGPSATAGEQALVDLSRVASVWFVLCATAVGVVERWSPVSVRYIALVLMAPSALLYFGWREFAYLSLNPLTFPLLARGLREKAGGYLEAGSVAAGFGAALHGAGLVSLLGAWLAAIGAPGTPAARAGRVARAMAWGTAAYVGWVAIYVIVLKLPIEPGSGRNWRPLFADQVVEHRLSPALASAAGARDLLVEALIAGVPLLAIAAWTGRRRSTEMQAVLWYLPASMLFLIFEWPFSGVGPGVDLVFAGFPALYALAWLCAHDAKPARVAALLLALAHGVFWYAMSADAFRAIVVDPVS